MRIILSGFMVCILCSPIYAGDLQGKVTVLRKNNDKPLKSFEHAVVYLEGLKVPPSTEAVLLDQKRKQFHPRVLVVQAGQPVNFSNSDKVKHNVFSKDLDFDLGYMKRGETTSRSFDQPGIYKIYCNIHIGMITDLLIVENPYYALTDKEGNFIIQDIPPGEYTLAARHIYGGTQQIPVTVSDQNKPLDIVLKSTQLVREIEDHLNKDGEEYPDEDDSYY